MTKEDLKKRTKVFAIDIIKFCDAFPNKKVYWVIVDQIIRSATSVGANYRASLRAKSKNDFAYKINIVLEEADETCYWLEVLKESELMKGHELDKLLKEANELTSIFAKTLISTRANNSYAKN